MGSLGLSKQVETGTFLELVRREIERDSTKERSEDGVGSRITSDDPFGRVSLVASRTNGSL